MNPSVRWIPWAAVALSLAFRALYFIQIWTNPYFDVPIMDEGYHDLWAREIAAGEWASRIPFFRAPLYPALLGLAYRLFGADPAPFAALRGGQLLLGAFTPWLVYRIARRLVPAVPLVAAVAAFVAALDGIVVYFEADLLLESLLAPLGALFVLLMLRAVETGTARRWAWAGLVLGLFAITRPNVLLFAPVLFWVAWSPGRDPGRRAGLRAALALTAATCLCVLPITALNVRGGDRVLIASQAGLNFFLGNNVEANGWSATAPSIMSIDWWGGYEDAIRLAEEDAERSLRPSEVSRYWFGQAGEWWRTHPIDGLKITLRKTVYFFSGTEFSNNRDIRLFFREFAPIAGFSLWLYYAIMPLALLGAISIWRSGTVAGRVVVLYLAVYALSIIVFFVTARYRVPLRPILAILAVEGARWAVASIRVGGLRGAFPALGALLFAVAVNANPWIREYRPTPAQFYQSVANVHHQSADLAAALDWQQRALTLDADYPKGNLNLGTLYMEMGKPVEAIQAFRRERVLDPDDAENLASLAQALLRTGDPEGADEAFTAAEARGLVDAPALYNHGLCLERLSRVDEAEAVYRRAVEVDPGFVDAWNNLGVLKARAGLLDEAITLWERALEESPSNQRVLDNLRRARARPVDPDGGG
ncbi:MAG: hypothetical protein DHS20C21_12920 [Gemmatimonadota bacterium]|nr:MAG: hypothetical protein DHS20C21_12920 [Gemmatimonadota bacterium]